MYSRLTNLVFGFHGCDYSTFERVVVRGESLTPSSNDYDWLGSGIYFWEQSCKRAVDWAKEQAGRGRIQRPAVIGAVIDLGYCLNLTDSHYTRLLSNEYQLMKAEFELLGKEMPQNYGTDDLLLRKLDCAVIEHLHNRMRQERDSGDSSGIEAFDSARGLFSEGAPIYPNAGIREKTHIQICVRNPNCIKGYFAPRDADATWRMP